MLERTNGAIFSLLAIIDGEGTELPGFILAPNPHPKDKNFYKKEGKNWFPENFKSNVKSDIGVETELDEMLHHG
ncbi:MAG: hypothetical protein NTU58_04035 [Candidatus Nealsonbacteria bacterium]|nr:hypothetical protein [Candidatus Nealsonbacteria bacterium]